MIVVEKERKKYIKKKENWKKFLGFPLQSFFKPLCFGFLAGVQRLTSSQQHLTIIITFLKSLFFFSLKIVAKKLNTSKKFKYFLSLCLWTFLTLAEPVSIRAHK